MQIRRSSLTSGNIRQWITAIVLLLCSARVAVAQHFVITTDHADGVYRVGETARWRIQWEGPSPPESFDFVFKDGGLKERSKGKASGSAPVTQEIRLDAPGTLLLQVQA